jgi:hypothetical protein
LALFALFFAPIFTAWWMIGGENHSTPGRTTNSGQFIEPTGRLDLETLVWVEREPMTHAQTNPWVLVVYAGEQCMKRCMDSLYKVRQAHAALGKDQGRVARLVLFDEPVIEQATEQVRETFPGFASASASLAWRQALDSARPPRPGVFIADPNRVVFMYYALDLDPKGLIKDLKRVLKISKIG